MKQLMALVAAVATAASMCSVAMAAATVTLDASEVTGVEFDPNTGTITIGESDAPSFSIATVLNFDGKSGQDSNMYTISATSSDPGIADILDITVRDPHIAIDDKVGSAFTRLLLLCSVERPADGKEATATITISASAGAESTSVASAEFTVKILEIETFLLNSVSVRGSPKVGETLAAVLDPEDATATYQWYSSPDKNTLSEIPGATGATYTLTEAEKDKYIQVSASGSGDYTGTVASQPTGKVAGADVAITAVALTGEAKAGNVLTAAVSPDGAAVAYRWLRSDTQNGPFTEIPGAAGKTYRLTSSDEGMFIKAEVTGIAPYAGTKSAVSGKVAAAAPVLPGRVPRIAGGGNFDPDDKADVSFVLDPGAGANALNVGNLKIEKDGAALIKNTDYVLNQASGGLYALVFLQPYLSTLPAGEAKFDVTAPYSNDTGGKLFSQALTIRILKAEPTHNGNSSSESSSSTGGESPSSSGESSSGETTGRSPTGNRVSSNVSPTTGAVMESAAINDVKKAVSKATGDNASVSVKNAKSIAADVMEKMAGAAGDKDVVLHADQTAAGGAVLARLYIDIKQAAALKKDLDLTVCVGDKRVERLFNKHFENDIAVVSFGQKGPFGMEVPVAVKIDLSKLDTEKLLFYSYDPLMKRYSLITPEYYIDRNGYLRFTVVSGGSVIITDSPLKK